MSDLPLTIRTEREADAEALLHLHERAFGPGRFARTAYRLREGRPVDHDLCFVAAVQNLIVGGVRVTRVRIGGEAALILGPLAVEPLFEGRGIGSGLTRAAIARAKERGFPAMLLVGDMPFYSRFGFQPVKRGTLKLPGPVDPARLLVLELGDGALARLQGVALPV